MSRVQPMRDALRQMLALLEGERQALAALDIDRIVTCTSGKTDLCERLEALAGPHLDEECVGLLEAAKRLNEVNRRLRNLIATNVQSRLEMLGGARGFHKPATGRHGGIYAVA